MKDTKKHKSSSRKIPKYSVKKEFKAELLLKKAQSIYKPNFKLSEEDWNTILKREATYKACKEYLLKLTGKNLGFTLDTHLAIPENLCLKDILIPDETDKQKFCIPLEQSVATYILQVPKIFLSEERKTFSANGKNFRENRQLYAADTKYGIILYLFIEKEKQEQDGTKHYSTSLYSIFNGSIYFELFRYDTKKNTHYQRFKNGFPTREKIAIQGPHMHVYDEKFSVIFPNSYCHYDVEVLPFNSPDIKTQSDYLKNKFNLEPTHQTSITPETNITQYVQDALRIKEKQDAKKQKTFEK